VGHERRRGRSTRQCPGTSWAADRSVHVYCGLSRIRNLDVLPEPFWARLIANVGIVIVFLAFYVAVLKRP
jgi:hypothetical protein